MSAPRRPLQSDPGEARISLVATTRAPADARRPTAPLPVVLDMDTGVDDAVALLLAMASPELEVLAVTSVAGNSRVDECTRNNLLLTELVARHDAPPIARGASAPLSRPLVTAPEVHGGDGLGGVTRSLPDPHRGPVAAPAHEMIARLSRQAGDGPRRDRGEAGPTGDRGTSAGDGPRRPLLVATGPLTNLALALERDSRALDGYERIVVMGGAFGVPGNTGPVAEFNFFVDPEAAARVMGSGLPVTLVPLDVTTRAVLPARLLAEYAREDVALRPGRSLARILHRALDHYMAFQVWESGLAGGYMHDALAVACLIMPDAFGTEEIGIDVMTAGPDRGRSVTRPPRSGHGVHIVRAIDADRFLAMLEERVLAPVFG